ncbi:MAG: DUF6580 family putative transport protein [Pirellulales bacterium]
MINQQKSIARDLSVFLLLVAIGVAGRWGQPEWCFTPTAAAAIFAGFYFARLGVAAVVPIAILGISDLALEAHDSFGVMLFTYAVMTVPVLFGRWLRNSDGGVNTAWRLVLCGLVPATLFWIVSNFAVWAFQSDYEKSVSGLMECYWMAVPFYRWMLAGDVFYLVILVGCAALAGMPMLQRQRQVVAIPRR